MPACVDVTSEALVGLLLRFGALWCMARGVWMSLQLEVPKKMSWLTASDGANLVVASS